MTDHAGIARIAQARARNVEPWNLLRRLAGNTTPITSGTDARIRDIARALKADRKGARRLLWRIAINDLRVVWHTVRLCCGR